MCFHLGKAPPHAKTYRDSLVRRIDNRQTGVSSMAALGGSCSGSGIASLVGPQARTMIMPNLTRKGGTARQNQRKEEIV